MALALDATASAVESGASIGWLGAAGSVAAACAAVSVD
jgi:hypothetical protein